MTTVAFFNNKGGVRQTSLVYHLAWMLRELGRRVIAADLDPQANLTGMFLDETGLEHLWRNGNEGTIDEGVAPLFEGAGDIVESPKIEEIEEKIGLLMGDLALSRREDELSTQWPKCLDGDVRAFRVTTAFARLIARAGKRFGADSGAAGRRPEPRCDQPRRPGRQRLRRHPAGSRPVFVAGIEKRGTDPQGVAPRLAGTRRKETGSVEHRTAIGQHEAAGLCHHAAFHPSSPDPSRPTAGGSTRFRRSTRTRWRKTIRRPFAEGPGPELPGASEGLPLAHADGAGGETPHVPAEAGPRGHRCASARRP